MPTPLPTKASAIGKVPVAMQPQAIWGTSGSNFTLTLKPLVPTPGLVVRYPWGPMGDEVARGRVIQNSVNNYPLRGWRPPGSP